MAGTVVICFTDIFESTALLSRLGDGAFDDLRRRHFAELSREVEALGGCADSIFLMAASSNLGNWWSRTNSRGLGLGLLGVAGKHIHF